MLLEATDWFERELKMIRERFVSYAQFLEDLVAYHALREVYEKWGGIYIDVGANDPIEWSVSKALYEKGWRGINIEPLAEKYEALCADRLEDTNLNIGISDEPGNMKFLVANDLSSFDEETIKSVMLNSKEKIEGIVDEIEVKTLSSVIEENLENLGCERILFCKIDVEGFEDRVLKGTDFSRIRPWLFCVEYRDTEKWESILIENGYVFVLEDAINRWYVDSDRMSEIGDRIISGKTLAKEYDVFLVLDYEYIQSLYKTNAIDELHIFTEKIKWVIRNKGVYGLIKIGIKHLTGKSKKQ